MKTENENVDSLDELVFENRNKDYGAYVLRKEYADHVQQAFNMVCVAGAALVFLVTVFSGEPVIKVKTMIDPLIKFGEEPKIIVPIQPAAPQPRGVNRNLAPAVTTQPVYEEAAVEDATAGVPDGTATEETPFLSESTGNGPVDVPVEKVVEPPKIVDWAEVMPEYKGGIEAMMKFMQKKTKYPAIARRVNTQGTVFVSFIIDTGGKVMAAKVVKGISKECDDEAVRVISSMPEWNAGRMGNMPVMVRMVLPIKFVLNEQ